MKKSVERAVDTLVALGCELDHADRELRSDRWVFTHPNAPDETFKVALRSSEAALRIVVQRAKVAAGLATSETPAARERGPKISTREKREREAERKRREAARAAASAREAEKRAQALAMRRQQQVSQLDALMRGGRATPSTGPARLRGEWIAPERLADEVGVPDRAVRHAIDTGALDLYQVGRRQLLRCSEAEAWARKAVAS